MNAQVRIGMIIGPLLPIDSTYCLLDLAQKLIEAGHQVLVLAVDGPVAKRFQDLEIPLEIYKDFRSPILNRLIINAMAARLRAFQPNLLHAMRTDVSPATASLAKRFRIPYLITIHSEPARTEKIAIHRRWCLGIAAVSETVREELVNTRKIHKDLIRIIPNGIEVTEKKIASAQQEIDTSRTPVIGNAGRMTSVKGHAYFIQAAKKVLDAGYSAHFFLLGDGVLNHALRVQASRLKIDGHTTFVNHLRDYRDVMPSINIYVSSSLQEGFSLAVLDAMSWGKPVVASAVGGLYNLIENEKTGLLVPKKDPAATSAAIQTFLDHPQYARKMGRAGQASAMEKFPLSATVQKTEDFYFEMLGIEKKEDALVHAGEHS